MLSFLQFMYLVSSFFHHQETKRLRYCTTKGALDQLTKMMALELGPSGVRSPIGDRRSPRSPLAVQRPLREAWGCLPESPEPGSVANSS